MSKRDTWMPDSERVGVETESRAEQIRKMFAEGAGSSDQSSSVQPDVGSAVSAKNKFKTLERKNMAPSEPNIRRRAATVAVPKSSEPKASAGSEPSGGGGGGVSARRAVSQTHSSPTKPSTSSACVTPEPAGGEFDTRAESIASMFGGTTRTADNTPHKVPSSGTTTPSRPTPRKKSVAELDLEAIKEAPAPKTASPVLSAPRRGSNDRRGSSSTVDPPPVVEPAGGYDTKAEEIAARFGGRKGSTASVLSPDRGGGGGGGIGGSKRADAELDPSLRSSIGARRQEIKKIETTPAKQPMIRRRSVSGELEPMEKSPEPAVAAAATPKVDRTVSSPARTSNLDAKSATAPAPSTPSRNEAGPNNPMRTRSATTGWTPQRGDPCNVCGKAVYFQEKVSADGVVFHKACFRCAECSRTMSVGTYAALEGVMYCKPCFKKLFKLNGNYSEGFGKEQHKMKWQRANSVSY